MLYSEAMCRFFHQLWFLESKCARVTPVAGNVCPPPWALGPSTAAEKLRTTLPIVQLRAQTASERRNYTTKIRSCSQSSTLGAGRSRDRPPTAC